VSSTPTVYPCIVVDPPWTYENARGTQTRSRGGRSKTTAPTHGGKWWFTSVPEFLKRFDRE
jgi:hypothetical protein